MGLKKKVLCFFMLSEGSDHFSLKKPMFKGIEAPDCHWEAKIGNSKVLL